MKVLVTGGTGFIGFHLTETLLSSGHEVYCAVRDTDQAIGRLPIHSIPVGVRDILAGQFPFDHADALVHLAAIRHRWGVSDREYNAANVDFTKGLFDASRGRVDQFIYGSSIAVFGWPGKGPIDESYPYSPINTYGATKVRCEQILLQPGKKPAPQITIIRPSIVYGRRDPTGMLTKLATMIDRGIYATVGSGNNRVQLVHVADIVQGFIRSLGNPSAFGKDYIITAHSPIQINRLVDTVAIEIGKPAPKWKVPLWLAYPAALGFEGCYAIGLKITGGEPIVTREKIQVMATDRHYSISRAQDELGYAPVYDYTSGVHDFIQGLYQDGLLSPGEK